MLFKKVIKPFTLNGKNYTIGEFINVKLITPEIAENVSVKVFELLNG